MLFKLTELFSVHLLAVVILWLPDLAPLQQGPSFLAVLCGQLQFLLFPEPMIVETNTQLDKITYINMQDH